MQKPLLKLMQNVLIIQQGSTISFDNLQFTATMRN